MSIDNISKDMSKKKSNAETLVKSDEVNNLTTNDIFRLMDLYFYRKNYIYRHLYDSFDKFLEEDVKNFLERGNHVFNEKITPTTVYKRRFKYKNVRIIAPKLENDVEPMFPSDARHRNFTYGVRLIADVSQMQEIIDIASDDKTDTIVGTEEYDVPIANIPLMLRSKFCSLNQYKGNDKNECEYDPGGYFIVNGSEKVIISQDRMVENKPLVFIKKDSGTQSHIVQVNSRSYKPNGMMQVLNIKMRKDGLMTIKVPILHEINVFVLFRALGIESDKDIIDIVVQNENDVDMIDLVRITLDTCSNEKGQKIQTQEEAIDFLLNKLRVVKKYTETDKDTKLYQKKMHLMELLKTSLLPHMECGLREKAYYLGLMINKLLRVYLKRAKLDDRDSYINKRVDLPGDLLFELFKQQYKKMMSECNKFFTGHNDNDDKPINIINQIKPNTIEQGLKAALLTGSWIRRKGVAQMLQRFTFLQYIAFLRRVDAPGGDAASNKLTSPRHLHLSSVGLLCLTGDTEILMADGSIKLLKDIRDTDSVISVYSDTLKESGTRITNSFNKKSTNLLEIKTISGRIVKCTKDHPLLVRRKGEIKMINAGEITDGDQLITRHMPKYIHHEKEMSVMIKSDGIIKEYKDEFLRLGILDRKLTQTELELTARIIGASVTDGCLHQINESSHVASFNLGELEDAYEIFDDITKLGFGTPSISRQHTEHVNSKNGRHTIYNTWCVTKGGAFAYYLKLMGCLVGKKTENSRKMPEWITDGNLRIKRDFLSGFMGGDGCRISINKNTKYRKVSMSEIRQTTTLEHLDSTKQYMNCIRDMLKEFGVNTELYVRKPDGTDENKTTVCISVGSANENLHNFAEWIDYRYCNEKRRHSAPVIEYIKYRHTFAKNKQDKYDTIISMYEAGVKPKDIHEKTGIEDKFIKRVTANFNKGNSVKAREADDTLIGHDEFVSNYRILNTMNMAIPIESIKQIKNEIVYDFETINDAHTFVANGIVSHNCIIETPEHSKVGLTKHLALIASITIMSEDQYILIRELLNKRIKNLRDVPVNMLSKSYKVFLNGEWLGITDDPKKLETELNEMKVKGTIDQKNVSIVPAYRDGEIRIYCESGRIYRPIMKVNNNVIALKKEYIDNISLNKAEKATKITDWEEFITKYPDVIEYIDMELQPYLLLSDKIKRVEAMRVREIESIDKVKNIKSSGTVNRYNDMHFLRYSHCEFHPSLLLGEISTNVPFANRNAGPRNIFQYAQGRQAMGLYATNYRDRLDISYILYYPQKPLVTTRTAKYVGTEILPSGENVMVAIACYTGYNQEDSLVFNKTSVERGLFRSMSLKKHASSIQKNQSTAQDDIFAKPDPTKVIGMRHGSYEKLNDKGYVPEETVIVNGDIIIGKMTPIQDVAGSADKKQFRDNSETYKSFAPGVVDRVYIGIQNQDGHESRKMLVRSERTPRIGDKFCCYTDDHQVLTTDGWIPIGEITLDHRVASLQKGNTLIYMNPKRVFEYDINETIYCVNSQNVNLRVTKNHRMFVAKPECEFGIEKAEDIFGRQVQYKKNVDNFNLANKTNTFTVSRDSDVDKRVMQLDIWLEIFGKLFSHININKYTDLKITDSVVVSRLAGLLNKFDIKINKNDGEQVWNIIDDPLTELIVPYAVIGKFPDWVWTLKTSYALTLLTNILAITGNNNYVTYNEILADELQRLSLHAGCAANITQFDGNYYVSVLYSKSCNITVNKQNQYSKSTIKTRGRPCDNFETYNGKVFCCEVNGDGVIYVRRNGIPVWCGNSRHGQKGTGGILLHGVDMPFTKRGMKPDIIVNANAIPSRMTIGQLAECLMGKVGALEGFDVDGTPFEEYDMDAVEKRLGELGYDPKGYEELYNGMTGEKLKAKIFFGPTYYQRLKHMVEDKIHGRSRGTRTLLTHQPPEGRSRDGGLRLGEMERDAIIAHGAAKFLFEKMMYNSDAYATYVCDICGIFAQRVPRKSNMPYPTPSDVYFCPFCNNYNKISKIMIPYAFKLLIQELTAMCIAPRIRTKTDIYSEH